MRKNIFTNSLAALIISLNVFKGVRYLCFQQGIVLGLISKGTPNADFILPEEKDKFEHQIFTNGEIIND
jgi:hypothetical protein